MTSILYYKSDDHTRASQIDDDLKCSDEEAMVLAKENLDKFDKVKIYTEDDVIIIKNIPNKPIDVTRLSQQL